MHLIFTTCCYICDPEERANRVEYMEHKGMILGTSVEPCGDHNRLVVWHKPWDGDKGAEYDRMYR